MYELLITFPNAFETKRFIEHPLYSEWFTRRGTRHNSRYVTIAQYAEFGHLAISLLKDFSTAIIALKKPNKGKFKYTKLSK